MGPAASGGLYRRDLLGSRRDEESPAQKHLGEAFNRTPCEDLTDLTTTARFVLSSSCVKACNSRITARSAIRYQCPYPGLTSCRHVHTWGAETPLMQVSEEPEVGGGGD